MELFRHDSGEQVLAPAGHPEAERMRETDGWKSGPPDQPQRRRRSTGQDAQNDAQDATTAPDGDPAT